jgi:hypothetical protein
MTSSLKEKVLQMIGGIEDEQVLELIKNDIEYFSSDGTDIIDGLNTHQLNELKNLAQGPDTDYTLSEDEFIKATAKWRTQ